MIENVVVAGRADLSAIQVEFPTARFAARADGAAETFAVDLSMWREPSFDPSSIDWPLGDRALHRPVTLVLEDAPDTETVLQVLTRCQRFIERRNDASAGRTFDDVLARHRMIHDLSRPLVRADYEHALDVWHWMLRLAPRASLAAQVAALFHDVERLVSESEARVEHRARDYQAFKDAHAATGARLVRHRLAASPLDPATLRRVEKLVHDHERPRPDEELALLNDADALSFFSLNSCGFLDYYGAEHARRKIAYTLARLSPARRPLLERLRLRADFEQLLRAGSVAA